MLSLSNGPIFLDMAYVTYAERKEQLPYVIIGLLIYMLVIVLVIKFISYNKKDKEKEKRAWMIIGIPLSIIAVVVFVLFLYLMYDSYEMDQRRMERYFIDFEPEPEDND